MGGLGPCGWKWPLSFKDGRGSVWGERVKRAGSQRERDGGDSSPATTDTSIKQQYRSAFCALKHTRSSCKPALYYVASGSSFDASSEVYRGEDSALVAGNGKVRGRGIEGGDLVFVVFGCWKHRFTLSSEIVFFHHVYGF